MLKRKRKIVSIDEYTQQMDKIVKRKDLPIDELFILMINYGGTVKIRKVKKK